MSPEAQALAFIAGANSIFMGEKLLTTPNPGRDADELLLEALGLSPRTKRSTAACPSVLPVPDS